jgi:hypothetical protein
LRARWRAEVGADGELDARVQALEQRGVVCEVAHLARDLGHVALGELVGHRVLADVDPARELAEALERRQLAVLGLPRPAQLAVDRAELRGKPLEIQRVPLQTGSVQEPVGRRNPPPGDLDDRQAVHVQVDERVEEVERERAHRHGRQDTRVRWIVQAENLDVLRELPDGRAALVYIDPPFNTGRTQRRTRLRTRAAAPGGGDRTGFGGRRYASEVVGTSEFADRFDDLPAYLERARGSPVLRADGSLCTSTRAIPLREGPARRDLRARVVPERAGLGLRLRRARARAGRPNTTPPVVRATRRTTFDYAATHPVRRGGPGRA